MTALVTENNAQLNEVSDLINQKLLDSVSKLVHVQTKMAPLEQQKQELRQTIWSVMAENNLKQFHSKYGKVNFVPEKQRVIYNPETLDLLVNFLTSTNMENIAQQILTARKTYPISSHIVFTQQKS